MHMTDSVPHIQVSTVLDWGPHLIDVKVYMPGWTYTCSIHAFVNENDQTNDRTE